MEYIPITNAGKQFIKDNCAPNKNSIFPDLFQGKSPYKINDRANKYYNPNGVLPFTNPETLPTKIWTSDAKYNGKVIREQTSPYEMLGNAIIEWYDKYSKLFLLNANFMAAQGYKESAYCLWAYPLTSTASGISQFTVEATFDVVINKNSNLKSLDSAFSNSAFTDAEISAITDNINGNKSLLNTYVVNNDTGKGNRAILHQNIIDNPEIMIKAQCRYMRYISNKCKNIASSTLFGYSRGPSYAKPVYTDSIKAVDKSSAYLSEGIDYVMGIFNRVHNDFKFDLGMDKVFNEFQAKIDIGNLRDYDN